MFSVVYFSRAPSPKKGEKRALLGDLGVVREVHSGSAAQKSHVVGNPWRDTCSFR